MNSVMKPVFYSINYDELINLENKLMIFGFKTSHNSHSGYHYISVDSKQYKECLIKGRTVADPEMFGIINFYGDLVSIYHNSLAYAEFINDQDLDYDWIVSDKKIPKNILELLEKLDKETGVKIDIRINHSDCAYEFICYEELDNYYEISSKVVNILKEYPELFKKVYRCFFTGEVINDEEKQEKSMPKLFNLFKYSMFIQGINSPLDNNIAPKPLLNDNTSVSHYISEASVVGGNVVKEEFKENIDSLSVKYDIELYEKKKYISYWNAFKHIFKKVIPFKRDLVDYLSAITEVKIISEREVIVVTNYDVNRSIKYSGLKPINYKDETSVRNGIFTYPIDNGIYKDQVVEHFIILKNGKRLLHYSDICESFEVYEIPDTFNFYQDLSIIDGNAKVFNDNTYDLEDEDIDEILNIVYKKKKEIIKKCVNQK